MTANKRIFLNVAASYGRSLVGMACGLFSTRWVLEALGQTDLGLYGVIGSLTIIISFLNIQFATAISRFFAFSIGQAKVAQDAASGLEECRRWFNVAVGIHTVLPLLLVAVGYPIGLYAITHGHLVIPPDRLESCVWVWRFACIACFVGMFNVPFQGMYTAKQYIAELTVYNVGQTIIRTAIVYFMAAHPGVWLVKYAFWMMLVAVVPQVLICLRAFQVFPECHLVGRYLWSPGRFRQVLAYVVWQVVGSLGYVARTSGVAVVVNRFFGPSVNAAMGIGNTLAAETSVLTGALTGAFTPVIATAYGSGDLEYMRKMAYRTCKFGTLLTLVFALPLALEVDEVLRLWLKNPPDHTAELCLSLLFCIVVEKLTLGHTVAVNASGKLARYQTVHGIALATVLPVGVMACLFRADVWSVGIALMGTIVLSAIADVLVARRSVKLDPGYWTRRIVLPLFTISVFAIGVGKIPSMFWGPSFCRVVVTTVFTLIPFLWLCWRFAFDRDEKGCVALKLSAILHRGLQ